jgi:peptidoglycan/LPS O-acetylase OafA/YrhL
MSLYKGSNQLHAANHYSYFANLDTLRFFSFLSVFLTHTIVFPNTGNAFLEVLIQIIQMNYLSVPFFFALSSFLITYRLLAEREKEGGVKLLKFYKNRILRIWPAYFLIIIICFILLPLLASVLHLKGPTLPSLLPFLFFYVNFYIIEHGNSFTFALLILWSISIEEQFYIVWGALLKIIPSKKIVTAVLLLLFFGSIAFSYYYLHVQLKTTSKLFLHSIFVLQNFCAGALAAVFFLQHYKAVLPGSIQRFIFTSAYFILPVSYLFTTDFVLRNIIKSICYGLIIYDQSFNENRLFNAGKSAVLNYLGKISYGLYLYHATIIVIMEAGFHFFLKDNSLLINVLQSFITLAVTILVAHLSYRYIELKFLAMKST